MKFLLVDGDLIKLTSEDQTHIMKPFLFSMLFLGHAAALQAATTFVVGSRAVTNPGAGNFENVWPSSGGEEPANAIDGNLTNKYLNFAKNNTGYIYSLGDGATATVTGINFVSGNDAVPRDPTTFQIYGSNTSVASNVSGTVFDLTSNFTLIASGPVLLPDDGATRNATRTIYNATFANTEAYNTFVVVFPTVKGSADPAVNSMQIGEARLQTAAGGLDNSGTIAGGQLVIPEPSAALLGLIGACLMMRRRRSA